MNCLIRYLGILSAAAPLVLASCVKEEDPPPELPPAASFGMELNALTAAPLAAKNAPTGATAAPEDYKNFANAWLRVKVVQAFAVGVVALPALSIAAALTQNPRKEGDAWIWSVTVGQATADVELRISTHAGFNARLYITNQELDRFLWVDGNFGAGSGEWFLHDPALGDGANVVLLIHWTYVSDTDRSLTYEVKNSASENSGDTITFTVNGEDATLVYEDADDPSVVADIEWNTSTGVGSLTVPLYNGGASACWNELFENAACP